MYNNGNYRHARTMRTPELARAQDAEAAQLRRFREMFMNNPVAPTEQTQRETQPTTFAQQVRDNENTSKGSNSNTL